MRSIAFSGACAYLLLLSPLEAQQPTPVGAEFQVNQITAGDQYIPRLTGDAATGEFIVTWAGDPEASFDAQVYFRIFASDGSPSSDDLEVDDLEAVRRNGPVISRLPGGDFVIAWGSEASNGNDDNSYSVQARRFDASGTRLGESFQVNQFTLGYQRLPEIGSDALGNFVIIWANESPDTLDLSQWSLRGRRFASDGTARGDEFLVNTYTTGNQGGLGLGHSLAVAENGDFVAVWGHDEDTGTAGNAIRAQLFDSNGSKLGTEIEVSSDEGLVKNFPAAALRDNGDVLVAWGSGSAGGSGPDGDGAGVELRRFGSDGSAIGNQLTVNSYTTGNQFAPAIETAPDGGFLVVWSSAGSTGSDGDSFSVQAQRFDAAAHPSGGNFQVNSFTTGVQFGQSVFVDDMGLAVVGWRSGGSPSPDGDGTSVQARFLLLEEGLFIDGFETGDTSAWSSVTP